MELKEAINQLADDPYMEQFAWLIRYSYAMKCDILYVMRSDLQWCATGIYDMADRYADVVEQICNDPNRHWADFSVLSWAAQDSTLWQVTTKDGLVRELSRLKEEQCN